MSAAALLMAHPSLTGGTDLIDELTDLFGVLVSILGLAIRIAAREWKIIHGDGRLVDTGIYGVVRHPMYLGSFLAGMGLCVMLGSLPFAAVYILAFAVVHTLVARGEERLLMETWPEDFATFRSSVPAWAPSPAPLLTALIGKPGARPLSLRAIKRETSAVCGVLIAALLIESLEYLHVQGWTTQRHEILAFLSIAFALFGVWMLHAVRRKLRIRPQSQG